MVEFVREVYVREIELHVSRASNSAEAFFVLFARDLRALMQAPGPHAGREPIGRILTHFSAGACCPVSR